MAGYKIWPAPFLGRFQSVAKDGASAPSLQDPRSINLYIEIDGMTRFGLSSLTHRCEQTLEC
jgi:hypothetical protein